MKIVDNSAQYPSYSMEELVTELRQLHVSRDAAERLGTGTAGAERLIESARLEIDKRLAVAVSDEELIAYTRALKANDRLVDHGPK